MSGDGLLTFPAGFLWGAGTSAYQIEGAVDEDGRGESIWDRFSATPGAIADGSTGARACDHYHRVETDLDLLAALGAGAYRFSIAWPRLFPDGGTTPNPPGFAFYDRLVDGLLDRGIRPAPTLYHWDLPQPLQDRGGWTDRGTVDRFAHYAAAAFAAFGDRVDLWMTHNEPWMVSFIGHLRGVHAPGVRDLQSALRAAHHVLLSHGEAVRAFRSAGRHGQIGIVLNLLPTHPATGDDADRDAAWGSDGYTNRWFLDPLHGRGYPDDTAARFARAGGRVDFAADGDMDVIAEPTDFLGVNYYTCRRVSASEPSADLGLGWRVEEPGPGVPRSGTGAEIFPEGLTALLRRLRDDYGERPLYVTENGVAYRDEAPDHAGRVRDQRRISFLRDHIAGVHRALADGVDVRGYFVWSLMDNFEWAAGYGPRFGLVYVDYDTLARIPKDSFRYYGRVIEANAVRAG